MNDRTVYSVNNAKHQPFVGLAAGVILALSLAACAPATAPVAQPPAATTASAPAATEKPAAAPTAVPTAAPAATSAPAPTATQAAAPATATSAPAAAKPATVSFAKDVKPILDQQCVKCHGGEKNRGQPVIEGTTQR